MHLEDAMFATLRIYFWACVYIYGLVLACVLFSYIIKVLSESPEDQLPLVKGTKCVNPFRCDL